MVETVRQPRHSEGSPNMRSDLVQDLGLEQIRARMETVQASVMRDVDKKLSSMVEEILEEIKRGTSASSHFRELFSETEKSGDDNGRRRRLNADGTLPEKEFVARNSLLTDLVEVKHIRAIYHMHIVAVIIMFLNCFIHDFVDSGRFNFGLGPIVHGFGGFPRAVLIWLTMQSVVLLVHPALRVWAQLRRRVPHTLQKPFDYLSSVGVLGYILSFGYVFTRATKTSGLGPASTIALLLEMTRFLMKTYAFIRSNAPRARLARTDSKDKPVVGVPAFSHYVYFLFCPTLVYRDSYPRNKHVRWRFVAKCISEVLGVILYMSFLFERYVIPVFQETGATKIYSSQFVLQIFGCMMPAILIFLSGFYLLLHSWMNAAAEVLRFADRMFYSDWWSATSFPEYYRKWNAVVHDWLFTYVYKDVYEHVIRRNKLAAMLAVFTISSLVHEYIIAFTFEFFYPVMLVLFQGCGVVVMFITNKNRYGVMNIFMWFSIILGNALMLALYNMEWHARRNCEVGDSLVDYFVPVSWSCHGISMKPDWKVQF